MGRINLQSLIDEVLGMAKGSQDLRKKKVSEDAAAQVNQSWDSTPEGQSYWKDIRGRTTAQQGNRAAMDLAQENNAGQLARQQLQQDFTNKQNIRTYNLDLFKERSAANTNRFNAQTLRQAAMDKSGVSNLAGSKEDPRSALFTALSQPGVTDEEAVRIKKMFDGIYGGGQPTAQRAPAGEQRNIQPPDVSRKGDYFTKDTTEANPAIPVAQNVPPPKTLDEQEAEFNKTKRSATGFSFFNNPKEIETNKQY